MRNMGVYIKSYEWSRGRVKTMRTRDCMHRLCHSVYRTQASEDSGVCRESRYHRVSYVYQEMAVKLKA